MASRGVLRRCRSRYSPLLFLCRCSSASCSSCASLPSSNATAEDFRTFSSSSSRGSSGFVSGPAARGCEDAGICRFMEQQSVSTAGERIASDAVSDQASVAAVGEFLGRGEVLAARAFLCVRVGGLRVGLGFGNRLLCSGIVPPFLVPRRNSIESCGVYNCQSSIRKSCEDCSRRIFTCRLLRRMKFCL
jgi:hypothetical protein